ncbi:hypothetical protein AKG11_04970 [Shinella sp. SUS2]|nr:hypothetical protein AKG11_04970 [Shinella sp. SUS2]KOC77664.1 hypothetical protein AKG10_02445 [Shinella sp. GWS1]
MDAERFNRARDVARDRFPFALGVEHLAQHLEPFVGGEWDFFLPIAKHLDMCDVHFRQRDVSEKPMILGA